MLYSEFLTKVRRFVQDIGITSRDVWDGDGSTTAFRTTHAPILGGSYTVKISGTTKTETSDYTIDKDEGLITFVVAPTTGSDNVTLDYKRVIMGDTEFIDIVNSVLSDVQSEIWQEAFNEATSTVANQDEYNMATIVSADVIDVISIFYKKSADTEWKDINTYGINWIYLPEVNKIIMRPTFDSASYYLRIHYIEGYALGTATSSTFEPATKYHEALKYLCGAEYWERFSALKINELGSVVKENSYENLTAIREHAKYLRLVGFDKMKRVKPKYPNKTIQTLQGGVSRF